MDVNSEHVEDIKALIESGDVDISERRQVFEHSQGRKSTLDDENMIRAIAATDDDDDELFVKNVLAIEAEQK